MHALRLNMLDTVLFSIFIKICLVAQDNVVLSECHILGNKTFWRQLSYYHKLLAGPT